MSRLCSSAADCSAGLGLSGPAGGKYCPPHVAPAARRTFVSVKTSCSKLAVGWPLGTRSLGALELGAGGGAGTCGAPYGVDEVGGEFVDSSTVNTRPSGAVHRRTSGSALDGPAVHMMQRSPATAETLRRGQNMHFGECSAHAIPGPLVNRQVVCLYNQCKRARNEM